MLSINPFISNQYNKYQNKTGKNNSTESYTSIISFKSAPIKTEKQVLADLRIAIKNAMSGIYQKIYNNGNKVEIELKNGKKVGQKIFNTFDNGTVVQIFKNRKLKKVMAEYNINNPNSTTYYSNNNVVRFVEKDKKGHIIYEEKYKYGKDNLLVSSTARDNFMKSTSLVTYNDIGQATIAQVNYDKGVSNTYKYINTILHEKVISAPNGASCTTTYYYGTEMPNTVIGQYNNYRRIEYYSPEGKLTSSLTDYKGQTLKVFENDKDGTQTKGILIDNQGSIYAVESKTIENQKITQLFDMQDGMPIQATKEQADWINDIEINEYEILKLVDGKPSVFIDPSPIVFKKINSYIPKEISETSPQVLDKMISNNKLIPIDSVFKKIRSN